VIVGRGCLGRPWLFRELVDVFDGRPPQRPPNLGEVISVMLEHASLSAAWFGETPALVAFRRHASWYMKGFHGSSRLRQRLMSVSSVAELAAAVSDVDPSEPFPRVALRVTRGKKSGTQIVRLPEGFLNSEHDDAVPDGADSVVDGG
jgi:hypothetical protein